MMKRDSQEDKTNFLQTANTFFSKKRKQINKIMWKVSIGETNLRKATISSLDSFDKKKLPVLIPIIKKSKFNTKNINIVIIGANVYYTAFYLTRAHDYYINERYKI